MQHAHLMNGHAALRRELRRPQLRTAQLQCAPVTPVRCLSGSGRSQQVSQGGAPPRVRRPQVRWLHMRWLHV